MPSHYLNQCWLIVNYIVRNKLPWNFYQNASILYQENALENMTTILFPHPCVQIPPYPLLSKLEIHLRADSRFAPSQWETSLLCTDVSHWLVANLESALHLILELINTEHLKPLISWPCLGGMGCTQPWLPSNKKPPLPPSRLGDPLNLCLHSTKKWAKTMPGTAPALLCPWQRMLTAK